MTTASGASTGFMPRHIKGAVSSISSVLQLSSKNRDGLTLESQPPLHFQVSYTAAVFVESQTFPNTKDAHCTFPNGSIYCFSVLEVVWGSSVISRQGGMLGHMSKIIQPDLRSSPIVFLFRMLISFSVLLSWSSQVTAGLLFPKLHALHPAVTFLSLFHLQCKAGKMSQQTHHHHHLKLMCFPADLQFSLSLDLP